MYYKYSELYKQNSVDKQLKIEYDGGVITNNELYSESFELTESLCSETNLKFGTCEASVLKFKIANVVESLKGKWLTVTETLAGNENIPFQFGKYKVYSDVPSADRNYRDVTAYDSMYDILNADMTEWWNSTTGSATIRYLRISFLDYFGIECEDIELPNDYMIVQFFNIESLSGKDFINAICELNGCFGHIGRDGKFYFKLLTSLEEKVLYPTDGGQVVPSYYFDGDYNIIDNNMYFRVFGDFVYTHKYKAGLKSYSGLQELRIENYNYSTSYSTRKNICLFADLNNSFNYNNDGKEYYHMYVCGLDSWYGKAESTRLGNYEPYCLVNDGGYSRDLNSSSIEMTKETLPNISNIPVFTTWEGVEYYCETGDPSGAINYFKGESKEETDNENSQIDVLYPSDSLYSVSSIVELQNRFFDGNYKIVDKYFYFRVYGQFITKGTTNVEEWHEGSYEARFRVPNGCERACIRWKSGFYTTYNDETYYSPEFHWVDTYGERQVDNDVYPEIDFNGDGTFESQKTIYVRVDDFKYMSGVPVFEIDQELYSYLSGEDTTHYINWNGINEIEKSRCISGKYEDYTVRKIDCVQIKNEENDIGAVAGDGENPYIIEDCFLCYGKSSADLQPIVNNIYNTIKDITYLPYEAEVLGNPCLEVADRVSINARNKTIDSYILKRTIRGIQGLRDIYSATGEEIQNKKVNSVSKSIIQLKKQTNTLKRTVDETISEIYSLDESGEKISKIQQNADAISMTVSEIYTLNESGEKVSRIQQNADAISLKVNKGEVSSEISVESGSVSIKGNRLTVESDNFKLDGSGEVAVTGSIRTSGSYDSVAVLDSGSLGFEIGNDYIGAIAVTKEAETLKSGMTINSAQKFLSLGIGDNENAQAYYILNNGLNVNGVTDRHYFDGRAHFASYVTCDRLYFGGIDDITGYISYAGSSDADARIRVTKNFSVAGDFNCGGTKNRVVKTKTYGNVLMNAMESTGAYFTDIGSGKITDGVCYVYLDNKFMEVIDTTHEYQVFVTNTSKEKAEYIEKHEEYFVVHGEDGATFDWILTAKQRDYQNIRMETFSDEEEEAADYDESVFYEDGIPATQTEEHMREFVDNIDDNAIAYVQRVAEMESEQFLL